MQLSNKIINKLIKKDISISIVESCTGGLVSSKFTTVPGVSKIFNLGLVTYSNKAKNQFLKISSKHLLEYGAVSKETASLMVKKLKILTKSKLCISTTGIAGPTGGSKLKPVGLVYIGIIYKNKTIILEKKFKGSRKNIQNNTLKEIFITLESLI